jgi:hypothetical protein
MPAAQYPDGTNVYLSAGIRSFLRAHGIHTPVVTTGKIPTPAYAEAILQSGDADLVGFARALLADPDWPKKARLGAEDRIIRCVYGNVCKSLDENFRQVRCVLWTKEALHAPPDPGDVVAPTWPPGSGLRAELKDGGQVRLSWGAAQDVQGVYGYDVFRSVNGGPFSRLSSCTVKSLIDSFALAGNTYSYLVRAYDFAGNRSLPSNEAVIALPADYGLSDSQLHLDGRVEAEQGYHA